MYMYMYPYLSKGTHSRRTNMNVSDRLSWQVLRLMNSSSQVPMLLLTSMSKRTIPLNHEINKKSTSTYVKCTWIPISRFHTVILTPELRYICYSCIYSSSLYVLISLQIPITFYNSRGAPPVHCIVTWQVQTFTCVLFYIIFWGSEMRHSRKVHRTSVHALGSLYPRV
jgi:hypothetical protein